MRKKLKRVPSRDERELESAEVENNNAIIPPSGFQKGEEGIRPRAIVGQSVLVLQDDATECACVFQDDCDAFQSSLLSSVQNLDGESVSCIDRKLVLT